MDTLAVQLFISHYLGMFRTFTCESAPMARKRNVRHKAQIKKLAATFMTASFLMFQLTSLFLLLHILLPNIL